MLRRVQGKLFFGTLQDGTGRIQLFGPAQSTPDFEGLNGLSQGDWIGVSGEVMKTRRGELSVRVDSWTLLAEARRQFPDKWHGISDTDTRYRQRYVDLWVTDEARRAFVLRSRAVSLTRRFLEDRGYMEVETPVFHPIPGGALARPFVTHHNALDLDLYLRIAPELYLKRLVVGGFERVFEIARVFRNEGLSPRHNPEFTMLELYEAYGDYHVHMALTEELVAYLATELLGTTVIPYQGRELEVSAPWRRATMTDLVEEQIGRRLDITTPVDELRPVVRRVRGARGRTPTAQASCSWRSTRRPPKPRSGSRCSSWITPPRFRRCRAVTVSSTGWSSASRASWPAASCATASAS